MINKDNVVALTDFVDNLCTDPLFMGEFHCPPVEKCPLLTVTSFAEYTCERCWMDYMLSLSIWCLDGAGSWRLSRLPISQSTR